MVLQEIADEDPVCLERRAPFQENRVFLGVVGSQDGHLCWNCGNYNDNNKNVSIAHLKFTKYIPNFIKNHMWKVVQALDQTRLILKQCTKFQV